MSVEAFSEWASMGRHGLYVWLAYGSSFVTLLLLVIGTRLAFRRALRDIAADVAAEQENESQ